MKRFLIIFIGLTLSGFWQVEPIEEIRRKFNLIESSLNTYSHENLPDIHVYQTPNQTNYSIEGTEIYRLAMINMDRYFDKDKLRKITVNFNGDRADLISDYYYWNDSLFFVYKRKIIYKRPKWADDFDENKKEVVENRYYFKDEQLIKLIKPDKEEAKLGSSTDELEQKILSDSRLYQQLEKK